MEYIPYQKIVLVGMMGCGKTTIGRLLAKKINFTFFDSDQIIEQYLYMPIYKIFANYQEEYFRRLEKLFVCNIINNGHSPFILSLGGGGFIQNDIRQILKKNKVLTIWLQSSLNNLLTRLKTDNQRPLIKDADKRKKVISELLNSRQSIYAKADLHTNNNYCISKAINLILSQIYPKSLKISPYNKNIKYKNNLNPCRHLVY